MSTKSPSDKTPEQRRAELDALLSRGVQADRRATKPPVPAPVPTPVGPTPVAPASVPPPAAERRLSAPIQTLERLSIRFTKQEAELVERVKAVARTMGYKLSDNAAFRLALNTFRPESVTPVLLEQILSVDTRRRNSRPTG